jgi:hypothetical protein
MTIQLTTHRYTDSLDIVTEDFRGFPQSLQRNAWIITLLVYNRLFSNFFPIHYPLTILTIRR